MVQLELLVPKFSATIDVAAAAGTYTLVHLAIQLGFSTDLC